MSAEKPPDPDGYTLFERLAASDDADALVVYRGEWSFVVMNLYPYNNGHLMVAPYRRVAVLEALEIEERSEIMFLTTRCTSWLGEVFNPDGFNIGMNIGSAGGAGVPDHLHMHVVPRWEGDTNFMPVVGNTKVIPEDIRETYRKIRSVVELTRSGN
jgi:ATP adenylyltransferase